MARRVPKPHAPQPDRREGGGGEGKSGQVGRMGVVQVPHTPRTHRHREDQSPLNPHHIPTSSCSGTLLHPYTPWGSQP